MKIRAYLKITEWWLMPHLGMILGSTAPQCPYVTCLQCGDTSVKRLKRRDRVDKVSHLPWSTLQKYFGGKLFHCSRCRIQFYDCRKQLPSIRNHLSIARAAEGVVLPGTRKIDCAKPDSGTPAELRGYIP
jgi:hypothetical protein